MALHHILHDQEAVRGVADEKRRAAYPSRRMVSNSELRRGNVPRDVRAPAQFKSFQISEPMTTTVDRATVQYQHARTTKSVPSTVPLVSYA